MSPNKSEGVRRLLSMGVEAETSLNYSASKPVKKHALLANKVENIMKPLTRKCRELVKLNNAAADQNKLENNTSNNIFVSDETMASKYCKSISQSTSDPKMIKSRTKPRRMRSMVEIYGTAQHCTIEELERKNGNNLAASSSVPAQDTEIGSDERKRKSPVNFEEKENVGDVYVDENGTKLRILSKFNDLSSRVMESVETRTRRHVDGGKRSKVLLNNKKRKKLQNHVSDSKKLFYSPRNHQNSQITGIQEHSSGPEEHLEEEEAFARPQMAHGLVKHTEPESVCQRDCSKLSVPTKMEDKGDHVHPTLTSKKKLAGVTNVESPRYSYLNGGCGSKSNKSSGTSPAFPRSSVPHDGPEKFLSLRKNVRTPFGFEPCYDSKNPLGEVKQEDPRESHSSFKCRNKDEPGNKLNPNASLSIQKNKRALMRNANSIDDNSKPFPNGHDLSSKPRDFSSFTKKHSSRFSNPQASAPESTFGPKCKRLGLKRPHAYCGSESDGEETVRQTEAKTSDNATIYWKAFKDSRGRGNVQVSGKGKTLVVNGMKSTSKHCDTPIDGINDFYSDKVTTDSDAKEGSKEKDVGHCEKDVVDEETCNNPLFETSEGLSKSSNVQCSEVAGHLDVQSDSRGYMTFYDGAIQGTEDARYPIESILNGGEKISYIDEDGKSIFGQNVHAMTELLPNHGSDSYYGEVDLIPIPAPPESVLPSLSSDELHENSTPNTSEDQSSENQHKFVDRDSSGSPSPTSTISNSDIGKFGSSLNEKLPFQYNIQDEMKSSVPDVTGGTMVDKISLDASALFAGGEGLAHVQPKNDLLHSKMAPPSSSWPTMPPDPVSSFSTQVNSDQTRPAKDCNSMFNVSYSEHLSGELHNSTEDPLRLIPNKACTNTGTASFNTDGEIASPSTSNHVFRLMGKDLMVVNKVESSYSHQTAKEKTVIDDPSESSPVLATYPIHFMSVMNHEEASIKPALMASVASPMNSNSMNSLQPRTSHSGSWPLAQSERFQVPPVMRVNPMPIKWNCVAQGSSFIPRGSFQSSPFAPHHMWSTTNQPGGFP